MSYYRHYDKRFGDLYEVYTDDTTGEFQTAMRSMETPGVDPIYYERLQDIPEPARHNIENLLFKQQ